MIEVHSAFLEELSDYLAEQDDSDARLFLEQVNTYFEHVNKKPVEDYQAETLAFIKRELTN